MSKSNPNNKDVRNTNECPNTKQGNRQQRRSTRKKNSKTTKTSVIVRRTEQDNGRQSNDVTWYSKNPELLRSAASIPFSSVLGSNLGFGGGESRVPGIMTFSWSPSLGGVDDDYTAVNQCAASMYSFLVHANSRNYTYEQSDLMMLVLSGALLFSSLANAIRAYGLSMYYKEQNMYVPQMLLNALGFDETFRDNLGQVWFDINQLISQTQQIWIPNTIPLIQRWFWMNSNVFCDADDPKGQIYAFVPDGLYEYNETLTSNGGGISRIMGFNPFSTTYSWTIWKEKIQRQINALVNSEDRGIIFGDILNAYGQERIYALPQIPADYRVVPVYNPEVLSQIENLTLCGEPTGAFYQEGNIIKTAWIGRSSAQSMATYCPNTPVLNFHMSAQPSPEAVMVATRLQGCGCRWINGKAINVDAQSYKVTGLTDKTVAQPITCGSETIVGIRIFTDPHGSGKDVQQCSTSTTIDKKWLQIQAFDWHPFLYNVQTRAASETDSAEVEAAYGDYANYTVMNTLMLRKLHTTALMSLFGVPQV